MSDVTTAGAPEGKLDGQTPVAGTEVRYPDPKGLETVFGVQRDHARTNLFRFLSEMEQEDFVRPGEALGGRSIRDVLVHMVDTEGFWLSILQNRPHDMLRVESFPHLDAVLPAYREATDRTLAVLHTADEGWFQREAYFAVPPRNAPVRLIPSMVVLHVLTHEFHHIGQICTAARLLGYTPPDTDLI